VWLCGSVTVKTRLKRLLVLCRVFALLSNLKRFWLGGLKMSDDLYQDPQLKALMQVMNDITGNKVPFYEPHELAARSTLRALQWQIDDRNVLDDGELIDVLNQARIEIKYLCSIITDFKQRIARRESEIRALEHIEKMQAKEIREQQLKLNENEVEIQRLERLAVNNV
jgi:hypothetical protein